MKCSVPTERALNLGASMGDLLFKLHPESPVICSEPDVTFTRIPDDGKAILLMASDGLFNYLPESLSKDKQQNEYLVKKYVPVPPMQCQCYSLRQLQLSLT
jgi:serine/threonine protein phosphatase PrpC